MYQKRTYRNQVKHPELVKFTVSVKETDLQIQAKRNLFKEAQKAILTHRKAIEKYIKKNPDFQTSLKPLPQNNSAPSIIKEMLHASSLAEVGPMACVAGVISEYVLKDLLKYSSQVIIENGGDLSMRTNSPTTIGLYAGKSLLNMKIGIKLPPSPAPVSVCTSSGTIGHSLSLGCSDAVCVVADNGALADAAATSIGNKVTSEASIQTALDFGRKIPDIRGIVIIINDKAGFWGDIEIIKL